MYKVNSFKAEFQSSNGWKSSKFDEDMKADDSNEIQMLRESSYGNNGNKVKVM